jgi:hypothetical protein
MKKNPYKTGSSGPGNFLHQVNHIIKPVSDALRNGVRPEDIPGALPEANIPAVKEIMFTIGDERWPQIPDRPNFLSPNCPGFCYRFPISLLKYAYGTTLKCPMPWCQ